MDHAMSELQLAVREVAARVLGADADDWLGLVAGGVLDLSDPLDVVALLIEVGRHGARVPVLETLCLGWPLRRWGDVPGDVVLSGAPGEGVRAEGGRLWGQLSGLPAVERAVALAFGTPEGVYAVDPADLAVERQVGTNLDIVGLVRLEGVPGRRIAGPEVMAGWLARVHVGIAALQLGLAQRALEMTAAYVGQRQQFGRPIGTFQAVSQRAADGWIDLQAMEVTLWEAAWRLSEGLDARKAVAIARHQAAEGSHRVLATAQHLHGGFGFDRDYGLHRYFLTSKQWEFHLGGASHSLDEIGALLEEECLEEAR